MKLHPSFALKAFALSALALSTLAISSKALAEGGTLQCSTPPPMHCPDANCPAELIANQGNTVDVKTGRAFFLDFPCDLKEGEKVTFILNLHGGGSIGNWQRHYFPAMDLKEKHRLVIASPSGVVRAWVPENDDAHLQNIVEMVYAQFGAETIKAFWLVGHSQGGQTSNRLLTRKPFIQEKLTGWVSLSGGRLGSKREDIRAPIPAAPGAPPQTSSGQPRALAAYAEVLPDFSFSHIYSSGEHELAAAGLPSSSKWAEKLGCGVQTRVADIADTKAGYIYDSREQPNRNKVWGLDPKGGTTQVYTYPNCKDGHVVADIIRVDKGHTEGLEPNVTEAIVTMMLSATR